jgi:uncharacterized zinc-type alcohol dehydrogenase-like protein
MLKTFGYAAQSATAPLGPFAFERRNPGPNDVQIEILYCGVCHTDIHWSRNDWPNAIPAMYPIVPGHEIVGRVLKTGGQVKKFKEGDLAAVGCLVDSCRVCPNCREGLEQYCDNGFTLTYNSLDKISGGVTYGGYSDKIVVDEKFVLKISSKLDLAATAPLLCAGITTYSPLKHWKVGSNQKVGVVGLGGLGHMGVKFASALGAHVVLFTTSPGKAPDAMRLGAREVVISTDPEQMRKHASTLDFILDTVAVTHDLDAYINLLKRDGTLCLVGVPAAPHPSPAVFPMIFRRRVLAGSLIGGLAETQEMLDFCAEHSIVSDIELIPMHKINEAYDRILKNDVKYRFVIDMATLKNLP